MSVWLAIHGWSYWPALALAAAAAVLSWTRGGPSRFARPLVWAGLAVLTVSVAARWVATGHPPIFGAFENSLACAWSLLVAALGVGRWASETVRARLPRLLLPWAPAVLAFGLFFEKNPYPLTISERSLWVDAHVFFAWWAFCALLASSMAAVALLTSRDERHLRDWDRVVFAGLAGGFAVFTVMLAIGSYYSYLLFSEWYEWEIVESLSAAAWLGYGLAVHARLSFGWKGRRLAWCALAVLPLLLLAFWVWSVYPNTYHYFELPMLRAS